MCSVCSNMPFRGNIKDGKPDGYGMLKQGKFLGNNMKISAKDVV